MKSRSKKDILLSRRMQMVADMVTVGNAAADIGCDHGFVSIYLYEKHICPSVIAMDINQGPLLRAKEHITERGLDSYIDVRLSDGMEKLGENEADTVIIAGMGGRLVIRILSAYMDKAKLLKELILQPQSELHLVRRFLNEKGFLIVKEDMVEESGKYYPCIKAVWGKGQTDTLSETEEWYGPVLLKEKHPVLYQYLSKEKANYEQIADKISHRANGCQSEETNEFTIQKRLQMTTAALACFNGEV